VHDAGVVHGDLRPSNVRIVQRSDKRRCVLAGFGASVILGDEARPRACRWQYAPPECGTECEPQKEHDVYSFGVLLWFMMYATAPWPFAEEPAREDFLVRLANGEKPAREDFLVRLANGERPKISEGGACRCHRCHGAWRRRAHANANDAHRIALLDCERLSEGAFSPFKTAWLRLACRCWASDPAARPDVSTVQSALQELAHLAPASRRQ
jgi:serine/threonine protein kinase